MNATQFAFLGLDYHVTYCAIAKLSGYCGILTSGSWKKQCSGMPCVPLPLCSPAWLGRSVLEHKHFAFLPLSVTPCPVPTAANGDI